MPILNPPQPSAYFSRLGDKLGLTRVRSDRDLAAIVEKGLPASAIRSLVEGGLSDAEVYRLIVPRRTLAHRTSRQQTLSQEESDKAVRVARIAAMAESAFADGERAWRWLRKPKQRFDGRSPLEMLSTEPGARLVEEMIVQFEHDIAA